jgi:hemoglobin
MARDIKNRDDILLIVDIFYSKLLNDNLLKHFFSEIVEQKYLREHIELITDFWNSILFNDLRYQRNALQTHLELNKTKPFEKPHFKRWLQLFKSTVDDNFQGKKAEMAKTRAISIATVMEIKMALNKS